MMLRDGFIPLFPEYIVSYAADMARFGRLEQEAVGRMLA